MPISTDQLAVEMRQMEYSGLTDKDAAAKINAKTVDAIVPIVSAAVRRYLQVEGRWPKIAAIARGLLVGSEAEVLAAVGLIEALDANMEFDLSIPSYAVLLHSILDACIATTLISAIDKEAMLLPGSIKVPWYRYAVNEFDIIRERGL